MIGPTLHLGDCLEVLRTLPDESVHAVITDPPYGLAEHRTGHVVAAVLAWCNGDRDHVPDGKGFMGREWDAFVPPPAVWDECLRVLKPGGHLLAFAGSRTADLMGLSVRMAGFEIRDTIMWVYGSGFPKGQNIGKAIDATLLHGGANSRRIKQANESRPGEGREWSGGGRNNGVVGTEAANARVIRDEAATPEAARWEGWNTSLKPAQEPIIVARKPLTGTVAATVLAHGTGGINVDATRVASAEQWASDSRQSSARNGYGPDDEDGWRGGWTKRSGSHGAGRWPANVVLVHDVSCEDGGACAPGCPVAELDRQSGTSKSPATNLTSVTKTRPEQAAKGAEAERIGKVGHDDSGGASRFFPTFRYQAKAPARERPKIDGKGWPTVKPLALMRWLVRLVTPPGGTVLDPFTGSGTTLQAARDEGFDAIGIERDELAYQLAQQRLTTPAPAAEPLSLLDLLDDADAAP